MFRQLFLGFFFTLSFSAISQTPFQKLQEADSLFVDKKFTQAFKLYNSVLESGRFSPRMLLKMAYIKEGLGDYTSALYYLNLFYTYDPDKKVLRKMEDLAERYNLSGYSYTDFEYFISMYNEYYYYIIFFFLFAALSFYLYIIIKKSSKSKLGIRPLFFIGILGTVFYLSNYRISPLKAIIVNENIPLMSDPSAASKVVAMVGKGHRVSVVEKTDIWYKIIWNDEKVYIRENDLLLFEKKIVK